MHYISDRNISTEENKSKKRSNLTSVSVYWLWRNTADICHDRLSPRKLSNGLPRNPESIVEKKIGCCLQVIPLQVHRAHVETTRLICSMQCIQKTDTRTCIEYKTSTQAHVTDVEGATQTFTFHVQKWHLHTYAVFQYSSICAPSDIF